MKFLLNSLIIFDSDKIIVKETGKKINIIGILYKSNILLNSM